MGSIDSIGGKIPRVAESYQQRDRQRVAYERRGGVYVSAAILGLPGLAGVKTVRRRTSSMVLAPEMSSVGVSALFDNTATLEKVLPYRR